MIKKFDVKGEVLYFLEGLFVDSEADYAANEYEVSKELLQELIEEQGHKLNDGMDHVLVQDDIFDLGTVISGEYEIFTSFIDLKEKYDELK